ncbi:MAG: hypothetical protein FWD19_02800 [Defluviitaleaceae bacterium]|nr:hypothetical protein [Defluviitaleaceae bacterium]
MKAFNLHMGRAKIALDLGDGSERGEYVNQDYILHTLGRPHRAINLMYCYYPLDEGWPTRASELPLPEGKVAGFAWDYAYDDYFTYGANGEPFNSIKDVRKHGQDVILTLTCDCAVPDENLIQIAENLKPFGRIMLRINHEATGNWFAFNKRYSYQEVADFYVRFHKIIKKHAPNVQTILCIADGHKTSDGKLKYEDEFAEAIKQTDMWSGDTYLSLHWGWPFDIAEPGGTTHKRVSNTEVFEGFNFEYERFMARGEKKSRPFVISEFNADGDVNGAFEQAEQVEDFYLRLPKEAPCITGVTFYQFRDRGRLGLEIEDPSNADVGYAQPILQTYKKIMNMEDYLPKMTNGTETAFPAEMRWGGSEDADGIFIPLDIKKLPTFCEINFCGDDVNLNLMIEINGRWFYKKPGAKTIDLMPAFFCGERAGRVSDKDNSSIEFKNCALRIFAPPPEGVNDPSQGDGWETNYFTQIKNPPKMRIRYEATMNEK